MVIFIVWYWLDGDCVIMRNSDSDLLDSFDLWILWIVDGRDLDVCVCERGLFATKSWEYLFSFTYTWKVQRTSLIFLLDK